MSDQRIVTAPAVSFEFFPPASPAAAERLWRSVERLAPLGPRFVSVTYGAGGTTRERTLAAIRAIRDIEALPVYGHLTCVGASREETLEVARAYRAMGCAGVVALRGDPPKGAERFEPHADGFRSGADLVAGLAADGARRIAVGCYPETHPEAASPQADIDNLKRKFDAGATEAITQFFFQGDDFLRFRDACAAAGIDKPITPGILPIENFTKMRNFAKMCGATVPDWLGRAFADIEDQNEYELVAVSVAAELCARLMKEGVEHLHIYTLNNPELTWKLCRALGIEPRPDRLSACAG